MSGDDWTYEIGNIREVGNRYLPDLAEVVHDAITELRSVPHERAMLTFKQEVMPYGEGMFEETGPRWRHTRSLLREQLSVAEARIRDAADRLLRVAADYEANQDAASALIESVFDPVSEMFPPE